MEFDRFSIALLILRPDRSQLDEDGANALQDAHLAHLAGLHDAGQLLVAGPLEDETLRGLCILKVGPEEARTLMEDDPTVLAGRMSITIVPWMVPAGSISFPTIRLPRSMADVEGG
jgi:uncharacterized protein YciI